MTLISAQPVPFVGDGPLSMRAVRGGKGEDFLCFNPATDRRYLNFKKSIIARVRRAGLDKQVRNPLLRHSFGTSAIVAGAKLRSLQAIVEKTLFLSGSRGSEVQILSPRPFFLKEEAAPAASVFSGTA